MARDKGKKPTGPSASSSTDAARAAETGAGDPKPGDAKVTPPSRASSAIAAKLDPPKASVSSGPKPETKPETPEQPPAGPEKSGGAGQTATPAAGTRPPASDPKAGGRPASTSSAASSAPSSAARAAGADRTPPTTAGAGGGGSSSGGFWPGLLGGIIGGAATVFAASYVMTGGDDALTRLESTATSLDDRLAQTEQQVGQIGTLSERMTALEGAPVTSEGGGDGELAARLDDLEVRLGALDNIPADEAEADIGVADRLQAIEQRIDGLAALEADMTAIEERVASLSALETEVPALEQQIAGFAAVQAAIPALEGQLEATTTAIEATGEQTSALGQSVETLSSQADQISGDVQSLAARLGDAEGRLDHIGGAYQRGAAMIVAIGDIDRAVARSEPFDSPLQSLTSLVQDDAGLDDALAALEPSAADGVPALAALKQSFAEASSQALLAAEGDRSLTDQVSNNVFGIINMRPSGAEAEGDDVRAVLARAQARLSDDDLSGTIAELSSLDGGAADAVQPWIARAEARLAAEAAVRDLRSHAQSLVAAGS